MSPYNHDGESHAPDETPDEDRIWQEIVDNYGERATIDTSEAESSAPPVPPAAPLSRDTFRVAQPGPSGPAEPDDEGHFIPPTPPKVPRARPDRQVAWLAMFGAPIVTLMMVLLRYDAPAWFDGLLFLAFVGGFGYLIATMEDRHHDGWDDGAVV